jgi:HEAT repeat protein
MVMDGTLPTRWVGSALALAALAAAVAAQPGCSQHSQYLGTTAKSFLGEIRKNPDPNVRYLAYHKLASPQCYDGPTDKDEAVRTLIEKLEIGQEPIASRAVICRTLGELRDPAARESLIKAVGDQDGLVRVQACRALGKVGKDEDAALLARVMTIDTLEDCRISAIEGLAELKSEDPRILQMLVAGMEHDDPAIRLASLQALRQTTNKDYGVEVAKWRDAVLARAEKPDPKGSAAAAAVADANPSATVDPNAAKAAVSTILNGPPPQRPPAASVRPQWAP